MKKILFSLVLIVALSLGINIFHPWQTPNGISNIVIAAEEHTDMSSHDGNNESHENPNSHDDGSSHEEKSKETDSGHGEEKSHEDKNELASGGHGHGGNSEYTPPNKIFLIMVVNIMVISIVIASIIKQRRGRAENESINQ